MRLKTGRMKGWQRGVLVFCLCGVIGIGLYGNALDNPFCNLDDYEYVVNNLNIRDPGNIPNFFTNPRLSTQTPHLSGHYRPLVTTSYAIDYALGGLNPVGYHLVNLAFHVGSAFLIFLIVQAMLISGQRSAVSSQRSAVSGKQINLLTPHSSLLTPHYFSALAAGLIFLVHPFNSEAVNYITARSSVMSGFFYLLGFYCWVRFRQLAVSSEQLAVRSEQSAGMTSLSAHRLLLTAHYFYIASLLAFVAGMLSKEVLITLPIVLWLYDLYFHRLTPAPSPCSKERPEGLSLQHSQALQPTLPPATRRPLPSTFLNRRAYIPYLPFVLVVVVPYLIIRASSFGRVLPHFRRDLWTQILTWLPLLVKHWAMFLFPRGLSVFHDVEIYHEMTSPVLLSGAVFLLYLAVAIFLVRSERRQWRIVSFFMVWFLIVLLPMVIIPLNQVFRESRGNLAVVSFAVLAGALIGGLYRVKYYALSTGLIILILSTYSAITIQRNILWGDGVLLWKDAVEKAPLSPATHSGLAAAYREHGYLTSSVEAARKGLSVAPDNFYLLVDLGDSYRLMGRLDLSLKAYQRALIVDPRKAWLWDKVGTLYKEMGDLERAEWYLNQAIKIRAYEEKTFSLKRSPQNDISIRQKE